MNHVLESFAWCMVQVTLFSLAAAAAYSLARRWRAGGLALLLAASLMIVGTLTLFVLSPYPRWRLDTNTSKTLAGGEVVNATNYAPSSVDASTPDIAVKLNATAMLETRDDVAKTSTLENNVAIDPITTRHSFHLWPLVIISAWIASTFGLIRFLIGVAQMQRIRKASVPLFDRLLANTANEVHERLGLKYDVDLRECAQIDVPATFGWLRPLVVLPPTWHNWSQEQLRAVLAHELAHIRERHFAAWIAAQLALVTHFYHPLVHWLTRRLRLEQELAADALAATTFTDRGQYATLLASLALGPAHSARLSTPLGLYMSRPLLMRRIAMLRQSNDRPLTTATWKFAGLLAGICLTAVVAAGCRPAAKSAEPEVASAADSLSGGIPAPTDPKHTYRAIILFKVQRQNENPILAQPALSDAAWKTFCNTQIAAIKSSWVLQSAFRDQTIAKLPLVKAQRQPIAWLRQRLQVGFDSGSELLYIVMYCTPGEADQAKQLVGEVARAYENEYIFKDKNQKLAIVDALQKNLTHLNDEIRRNTQKYLDLAHELGSSATDGGIGMQVSMKQLDRVETELMRVQNAIFEARFSVNEANMDAYKSKVELYTEQTKVLNEEREKLRRELEKASEQSVELSELKNKLEQSQQLANELSRKLQALEFDANAPAEFNGCIPRR